MADTAEAIIQYIRQLERRISSLERLEGGGGGGTPFPGFGDAEGQPANVAGTSADGTSLSASRRDHVHAIASGAGSALDADLLDGYHGSDYTPRRSTDVTNYYVTTTGWKRIAAFGGGSGGRGEMTVLLHGMGGDTPFAMRVHAAHGYAMGVSGITVDAPLPSLRITQFRTTNDDTYAYLEAYFASVLGGGGSQIFVRMLRDDAWSGSGNVLYASETAGGGTQEFICALSTGQTPGGHLAISGDSRAQGSVAGATVLAAPGGVSTGHMFDGVASVGLFGTANCVGITGPNAAGTLIDRADNYDSYIRLGYGNRTYDRSVYFDLFAEAHATAPPLSMRLIRNGGVNGSGAITNYGTGGFTLNQSGAGPVYLATSNARRLAILAGGNVGIGTDTPQGRLHVHDGTGGFGFFTKTGINATAQTIIPDGTGDVLYTINLMVMITNGTTTMGGTYMLNVGGSTTFSTGSETWRIRVNANGSVDVARTAGTLAGTMTMLAYWF